jgi:hypothetical protein
MMPKNEYSISSLQGGKLIGVELKILVLHGGYITISSSLNEGFINNIL